MTARRPPPVTCALALAFAVLLGLTACAPSGGVHVEPSQACKDGTGTIGFLPKLGTDPYMVTVRNAAQAAAEVNGGRIIYNSPSEATGASQIPFVNQLIIQHVCAIAISGSDFNSTRAALGRAREAGIPVVSWDSDVSPGARDIFINQAPSAQLGQKMLDSMAEMLGEAGGDFAVLSSTPTAVNQNAWIDSMRQRLATDPKMANLKLVAVQYGMEKADINAQQAKSLVTAYPNLKGMIIPAGIGFPAALNALSQIGALGRIKLTGLAPPTLIKGYIERGEAQDIWWNVGDLGTLTYYAARALAMGAITGKEGQTFVAGDLGKFVVGKNGEVLLGDASIVTASNVNEFPF